MHQRFSNTSVLVTRAGYGIGHAIALRFASEGAQVMARHHKGVIINMSSGGASHAHRGMAAYDASKGGIEALTRAMALDLASYSIKLEGE